MSRKDRAKQFAPFDALKGLQNALRLKEFEHDRIEKGDLSEEKIEEMSSVLSNINKNDIVKIKYFKDGHYFYKEGNAKVNYVERKIFIDNEQFDFDGLFEIVIKTKSDDVK